MFGQAPSAANVASQRKGQGARGKSASRASVASQRKGQGANAFGGKGQGASAFGGKCCFATQGLISIVQGIEAYALRAYLLLRFEQVTCHAVHEKCIRILRQNLSIRQFQNFRHHNL